MSSVTNEKQGVKLDQDSDSAIEKKQASPLETSEKDYRQGLHYYKWSNGYAHGALKAIAYFKKAAEQGHPEAQYYLGEMYYKDEGVADENLSQAQRDAKAVEWYRKAAAQGDATAHVQLGAMYHHNRGIASEQLDSTERYEQAAKYYHLGDRLGHKEAKARLTQLERNCNRYSWSTTLKIWGWTGAWRRFSVPSEIQVYVAYDYLKKNPSPSMYAAVKESLTDPRTTYLAPCISEEKPITSFSSPISSMARSPKQRTDITTSSYPTKSPTLT